MFLRMNQALNDRRAGLKREEGFTLIELLVVVIIIGILAAIAIPVFLGVQNNAKDAAVKSDLTNAKTAVIAYFTKNPSTTTPPTFDNVAVTGLSAFGFTQSADTKTIAWSGTAPASASATFCIIGTSSTTATFNVTDSKGVLNGSTCGTNS